MALPHAQPGDVIDLYASDATRGAAGSVSLLKTPRLQLLRLVLAAGHTMPEHDVPGDITIHCLEGGVDVATPAKTCRLAAGHVVMLAGGEPHDVRATVDSVLLVTILHPATN